ncbi:MAG: hypothetical protein ABMA14_08850 [Hyphomonadaceae bacterium]
MPFQKKNKKRTSAAGSQAVLASLARFFSASSGPASNELWVVFRTGEVTLIRRDETTAFAGQKAILLELSHAMAAC